MLSFGLYKNTVQMKTLQVRNKKNETKFIAMNYVSLPFDSFSAQERNSREICFGCRCFVAIVIVRSSRVISFCMHFWSFVWWPLCNGDASHSFRCTQNDEQNNVLCRLWQLPTFHFKNFERKEYTQQALPFPRLPEVQIIYDIHFNIQSIVTWTAFSQNNFVWNFEQTR